MAPLCPHGNYAGMCWDRVKLSRRSWLASLAAVPAMLGLAPHEARSTFKATWFEHRFSDGITQWSAYRGEGPSFGAVEHGPRVKFWSREYEATHWFRHPDTGHWARKTAYFSSLFAAQKWVEKHI